MVKLLLWALALLAAATAAGAIWFRAAPDDVAIWHVDPLAGMSTGKPNEARVAPAGASGDLESPVFEMAPAELMARLDAVALAEPRARRLAGDPAEGFATYVQRSALMGFPDYVSVRAVDLGEGRSALAIWSRSRYGHSDLGVNRARLERWMAALP
ncbi:DUF1499 domain-containing protein [Rubrimonas sp.]|uniref:DUF1499 domain-containing protein n=1 Tax=Rubrimonas sp. TaxID=2036015 RepID=UPI002FDD3A55